MILFFQENITINFLRGVISCFKKHDKTFKVMDGAHQGIKQATPPIVIKLDRWENRQ